MKISARVCESRIPKVAYSLFVAEMKCRRGHAQMRKMNSMNNMTSRDLLWRGKSFHSPLYRVVSPADSFQRCADACAAYLLASRRCLDLLSMYCWIVLQFYRCVKVVS